MTNPPPGMYPQQPVYGQQLLPGWENRTRADGSLMEAFDFSFDRYATPVVVKVIYMLVVISCVVAYLGSAWLAFAMFMPDQNLMGVYRSAGSPIPGIVVLVFGWIPGLILILLARVSLEQALATVRTAIDARAFRVRYLGPVTE